MSHRLTLNPVLAALALSAVVTVWGADVPGLKVNDKEYLETQGLNVFLYHSKFHPVFVDEKKSAMEIVLHGERIATNGDIRLTPAPEQWDPAPTFVRRVVDKANGRLTAYCSYPKYEFTYRLEVTAEEDGGVRVAIHLDKPLPEVLSGLAGLNLEFLPSIYWGKTYIADDSAGVLPRYPTGPMTKDRNGDFQPLPFATGKTLTLAPEDPMRRVVIASETGPVSLFDGRNRAQNGWFVVRAMIPAGKTENAVVWHVRPHVIPGWVRPPVVAHSQVGYHPARAKTAVIELDPLYKAPAEAAVLRLNSAGEYKEVFRAPLKPWGRWVRYNYSRFDFSAVREPGLYVIEYAGQKTEPFRIAPDVYRDIWRATMGVYIPVAMDHVAVREGYKIWHGPSHLDDARQAPVNTRHFDGYMQGPTTDSPFKDGERIPGLNVGGWYDAGDFDIRTGTQVNMVASLVTAIEDFHLTFDDTTVDQKARYVELRRPDGVPDAVQQVEHGVLQLLGQIKAIGHAIPGIIAPTLKQYTHLGDGGSKTDRYIYDEKLGPNEVKDGRSGAPDDRWAFTNKSTSLNYSAAAALAAASRVLKGYDDALAKDCFETAERIWKEEHAGKPAEFRSFNTGGGFLAAAEMQAAVELVIATKGGEPYKSRLAQLLPGAVKNPRGFGFSGWNAVRAIPYMDAKFKQDLESVVKRYKEQVDKQLAETPFGSPGISKSWGTSGQATGFAVAMYFLHKAFPELIGPDYTVNAVNYLLGAHPVWDGSWVSTVGAKSRLLAYGNNRAEFTFIAGGVSPGYVVVDPDLPEYIETWPFLWFENEYVVNGGAAFVLAAHAADELVK